MSREFRQLMIEAKGFRNTRPPGVLPARDRAGVSTQPWSSAASGALEFWKRRLGKNGRNVRSPKLWGKR